MHFQECFVECHSICFLFVTIFQVCSSGWNLSYEHFRVQFYIPAHDRELFICEKGYQLNRL